MTPTPLLQPDLPLLPPRPLDAHKGCFGQALLIGGSRGMAGAIGLAGLAAAQAGAGLVRLAVPNQCLETVASYSPCYMTLGLSEDTTGRIAGSFDDLAPRIAHASCIAIGPGLGQSSSLEQLIAAILSQATCPIVLDADGLNNLSHIPQWPDLVKRCAAPLTMTPHPGEWQRLCGLAAADRAAQIERAIAFSREHGCVIVLKGQQTLVTDGVSAVHNQTGTPAMATGGSGDVLTGILSALICQGLSPRDAAHLAVFVHGRAAQIAAQERNSHVVLPNALIDYLPAGFLAAREETQGIAERGDSLRS